MSNGALSHARDVFQRDVLLYVVCFTGFVVLAVEILAVRILAPFFGNTIFSFSSIISVILAALSLGYWYGGRLADRRPEKKFFFTLVFLSGIAVVAVHVIGSMLLPGMGLLLPITYGPLVASLVLFFLPAFIFGLLSPFVIKLRSVQLEERGIGSISGEVFFWSTMGSIAGSLLSGFYLVPFVGVARSMMLLGFSTALVGFLGMSVGNFRKQAAALTIFLAVAVMEMTTAYAGMSGIMMIPDTEVLYSKDGRYERVTVIEADWYGEKGRILVLDRSFSSGMSFPEGKPLFGYAQYWALYDYFHPELEHALVLGAGAGSVATALYNNYPNAVIDIVDIEPKLYELAHEYFLMPEDSRIRTHVADGRQYLRVSNESYDFVFADMYSSLYSVPWHVSTKEHYQQVYEHMNEGGVYVGNYIAALDDSYPSLFGSHMRTMGEVFDNVYAFAVESRMKTTVQNIMLVGTKGDARKITAEGLRTHPNGAVSQFWTKLIPLDLRSLLSYQPFTDDLAPVELYTAELLLRNTDQL